MTTWAARDLFDHNRRAAREAQVLGARVVRSCSGGLMRWKASSPATEILLEDAATALKAQREMLRDHGVVLAIETHFEFTSFELVRLLDDVRRGTGRLARHLPRHDEPADDDRRPGDGDACACCRGW